ncbi:MAG: carbohydrate ABC transporter permease [Geminicoccaceae bacterium]|jgi:multiple sugar transport system permease protein|nr:carbohydrate ABC transporter permease [Geminicoccaceae bacterium]HRY25661.1 carbohydrate ABC transporter permease [Geminicoccaceae bacterium]
MASSDVVRYRSPLRSLVNVLVAIFLVIYVVWTVLPLFVMFVSSFKDLLEAFKLPTVGDWSGITLFFDFTPTVKHYQSLFLDHNFSVYLFNSIVASAGSALISVVLGAMCAYSLSRINFRGKQDLFFWIISTRMAPVVAVMVPLYAIFRGAGLVGTIPGLILAYTTFNLPFAIWMLKGFFDNVPYAIEEAQMCDGATRFRAFLSILPLVAPGVGAFLVLCILFAWNDFLFASIIGSGGAKTLPVATKELVQPQNIQWGSIMAAGVVTTLPMMFLGLLIRRYLVAGLTMGAVKE